MIINFSPLINTYNELLDDYELSKTMDSELYPEFFIKRTVVRSYFALLEGTIYQLKRVALDGNKQVNILDVFEVNILNEKTGYLTDKGVCKVKPHKAMLIPSILFTIQSLVKVFKLDYKIIKDSNFKSFEKAIKIRDRITHPKDQKSIQLSDEDVMLIGHANIWFTKTISEVLKLIQEKVNLM